MRSVPPWPPQSRRGLPLHPLPPAHCSSPGRERERDEGRWGEKEREREGDLSGTATQPRKLTFRANSTALGLKWKPPVTM